MRRICLTRGSAVICWRSRHVPCCAAICSHSPALIIRRSRSRIYSGRAKSSVMQWITTRTRKMAARCWKNSPQSSQKPSRACTGAHGAATAPCCCEPSGNDYLDSPTDSYRSRIITAADWDRLTIPAVFAAMRSLEVFLLGSDTNYRICANGKSLRRNGLIN